MAMVLDPKGSVKHWAYYYWVEQRESEVEGVRER